jgi:hypothetical protein
MARMLFYYENEKNSPIVIIFTFIGMVLRFITINFVRLISGQPLKNFFSFAQGFKQVLYNILVILGLFIGSLLVQFILVYLEEYSK